jgi:hypothetical protein
MPLHGWEFVSTEDDFGEQHIRFRKSGEYAEVLTFQATATERGPSHLLRVGIDIDPAKLMGWTRPNRAYTVALNAKLVGPGLSSPMYATLLLPIVEQREISRDDSIGLVRVAYLTAGKAMPNGFSRGEYRDTLRFAPTPGDWILTIEMRTANNADQRMIKAIRNVRVQVLGPKSGKGALNTWTVVPPAAPGRI